MGGVYESHWYRAKDRRMRYNRTRPESRINTGFSLISSKQSAGKSTGGEDDFRSLGGERRLLRKREKKRELEKSSSLFCIYCSFLLCPNVRHKES